MNYVLSICDPNSLGILTNICNSLSLKMTVVLHGRGTAVRSMLDILGIEDTEKRIVLTIADNEKTKELIREEKQKMFVGVPGHGIIVSVPIKSVGGGKTLAYLNNGQHNAKYTPELNYSYELIIAISNEGCTDMVMNAARKAGARGGTVIHGKGTGSREDEKFFNVSIAQEKEVILIVSEKDRKSDIMREIVGSAGPSTPAGAIVFSLPISEVAGFGLFSE